MSTKIRKWNVCLNGRLPALRQFDTFDEAVQFVAETTGETPERVRKDNAAGCPSYGRDDNEYDIEKSREDA